MAFALRDADLTALNSLTKYPSIPTYHTLDSGNGGLLDETVPFSGEVIGSRTAPTCSAAARNCCAASGGSLAA
ncbi:MAG TPA: hypothetical protein VHZ97_13600 [Pseudonocardiaceae bacterium]|nr:hypothetical protein [Pseudonocardiaceae bacterium]